jgi:hypothetical protein
MRFIIESIAGELRRYKALAESALDQLTEPQLVAPGPNGGNSITTICWHIAGNLRSRFTDFLVSDGEKPWPRRDEEFQAREVTHAELRAHWETGWGVLFATLDALGDADLGRSVTIRSQPLRVDQALHRSLAHVSYHVGQVVYAARSHRGAEWRFLSIPPGQSEAFNAAAHSEQASAHVARLGKAGSV